MRADLAQTDDSTYLDAKLKDIAGKIEVDGFNWDWKLRHEYLNGVGCAPDGGLFYRDGYVEAAFEAKHQGDKGNAIERWFKNYWLLMNIYPQCKFITFCTGKGVLEGNGVYSVFNMVLNIEGKEDGSFNTVHKRGASFFISEYGFSPSAMKRIIFDVLENDGRSSGLFV